MNVFDFIEGKFIHSSIAAEGTQVCTALHTRQLICHIQVELLHFLFQCPLNY